MDLNINLMKKILMYMPLLSEGTDVLRPVVAFEIGNNTYKILGTKQGLRPDELDEEWLFPIGSYVRGKIKHDENGEILIVDCSA
jgi:hypothetical protein